MDPLAMGASVVDSIPFVLGGISEEMKKEMGHSIEESMPICTYAGKNCDLKRSVYSGLARVGGGGGCKK